MELFSCGSSAVASNSSRKRLFPNKTHVSPNMQRRYTERKNSFDLAVTGQKAIQQHAREHAERDKALKVLRSSTASKSSPRRLDLCLAFGRSWVRTRE